jgi:hypothetical protein
MTIGVVFKIASFIQSFLQYQCIMNFFSNKNKLKGVNYLDLTPYTINEFELDNGLVTILILKFKSKIMQAFLPRNRTNYIKIHLDEPGSIVWLNIDGKKNVSEIVEAISHSMGDQLPAVEQRVIKFLTQLFQQKFIGFKELTKKP